MKTTDFVEQWYSMQKAFLPPPEFLASSKENARRFWESQERILDNMQAFANGWFERRHMGTLSAREAAERMCGTGPNRRRDSGVSGLDPWSVRADHGRWTFLPATNLRSNQCADIAAASTFGK